MDKLMIGLDMSVTSTGVCLDLNGHKKLFLFVDRKLTDKKKCSAVEYIMYKRYSEKDHPSLDYEMVKLKSYENLATVILKTIESVMLKYNILPSDTEIYFERPSLQSKGQAALEIPILNALIRRKLLTLCPIENFRGLAPSQLKKLWTGNGRAKKPEMEEKYIEVMEKLNLPALPKLLKTTKVDDIIDAIALVEIHK